MMSEPFPVTGTFNFSSDQRTRVLLFAVNLELTASETFSVIAAQAEDSLGQVFPLTVEYWSGTKLQLAQAARREVARSDSRQRRGARGPHST